MDSIRFEFRTEMQIVWPHFMPKLLDASGTDDSPLLGQKQWCQICLEDIMEQIGMAYLANRLAHGQR